MRGVNQRNRLCPQSIVDVSGSNVKAVLLLECLSFSTGLYYKMSGGGQRGCHGLELRLFRTA